MLSVDDMKSITSISDNLEETLLNPFIKTAQLLYIEKILGRSLYEDIITSISTGGTIYKTLLEEHIMPCLAYYSLSDAIPFIAMRFEKKGITKSNSDNSENIVNDEMSVLIKRTETSARLYANRLVSYLNENTNMYPLYRMSCESNVVGSTNTIFTGFGKRKSNYSPSNGNYI